MDVNIQAVRFNADAKLIELISRKMEKLNQFHDRIISIDVYLKLDNVVHRIKDKVAEIKINIPRHEIFVKSSSKSFEESFEKALDSAIQQVKRQKEKLKEKQAA